MAKDRDLALLYGVETRALNQAVKRNIKRFPDDFMFQLDKEDVEILKSQTAVEVNIRIMRAFVSMRRFIATNAQYPPVRIERFNKAHDRFLLIDDEVYHIGASIKDRLCVTFRPQKSSIESRISQCADWF